MNKEQIEQNIKALQERRKSIASLLEKERSNAFLKSGKRTTGDVGDTDLGADLAQQDVSMILTGMEADELAKIDAAIERAHDGRYGICQVCGQDIEAKRLKSIPEASSCTRCEPH